MKIVFIFLLVSNLIVAAQQFVPSDTVAGLLNANGVSNLQDIPSNVRQMYIGYGNLRFYETPASREILRRAAADASIVR